jgi:hypothetical protein
VSSLAGFNIERLAGANGLVMYGRGACVAFVGSSIGGTGYMTENGVAWLIWRDGRPWLVSKGVAVAANPEQVREIQKFSEDLKKALEAAK